MALLSGYASPFTITVESLSANTPRRDFFCSHLSALFDSISLLAISPSCLNLKILVLAVFSKTQKASTSRKNNPPLRSTVCSPARLSAYGSLVATHSTYGLVDLPYPPFFPLFWPLYYIGDIDLHTDRLWREICYGTPAGQAPSTSKRKPVISSKGKMFWRSELQLGFPV